MNELNKVAAMLDKLGIPYTTPCSFGINRVHFTSPVTLCHVSIIYGCGTYGAEAGLLESMPPVDEDYSDDDVQGYLSADDIIAAFIAK
jgi:hypothetical protein